LGYHRDRGFLPPSLDALAETESGLAPANLGDPETDEAYEYRVTGAETYELCANFGAASGPEDAIRWRHKPGRTCFDLTAPRPRTRGR
jgi:hypothetical protein